MNQQIIDKLKEWRVLRAGLDSLELFMILHNQTIEDIAVIQPRTEEELILIKGISQKKFNKYGKEILKIVENNHNGKKHKLAEVVDEPKKEKPKVEIKPKEEPKEYTVSSYLNYINRNLVDKKASVKGEITEAKFYDTAIYFTIKDSEVESVMKCIIFKNDYERCGIELEAGKEIIIHGFPEVYPRYGSFTFKAHTIELVGEGVLKEAYENLKNKLEEEGLFAEERKKSLPKFPKKIGLITSRDGAVINDFLTNIKSFGYKIYFYDSRVEGQLAVRNLIEAVNYFKNKDVDVLVMIRGGGSLESLQAFNNESLIKEVSDLKSPLVCGIGHDKDVPLISLLADKAVSTPTAVAEFLNKPWQEALQNVNIYENNILTSFSETLKQKEYRIEQIAMGVRESFQKVIKRFEKYQQLLSGWLSILSGAINNYKKRLKNNSISIVSGFQRQLQGSSRNIDNYEKNFEINNPERQLKLGYSITTVNGKVLKSIKQIKIGDNIDVKLADGKITSEVKGKSNK